MTRHLIMFLLKVAAIGAGLGVLWTYKLQVWYPNAIDPIAEPIFGLFGVTEWLLYLVLEHFTSIIPFIALVLASPGLFRRPQRALCAFACGLPVIILMHIAMSVALFFLHEQYGASREFLRILLPIYVLNDSLPFILWLAFYWRDAFRLFGLAAGKQVASPSNTPAGTRRS